MTNKHSHIQYYLICPGCNDFMLSKIVTCLSGHSICINCSSMLKCCPLCDKRISWARNLNLEKIALLIDYICLHDGCNFTTSGSHIKTHAKFCKYGAAKCVLNNCSGFTWKENIPLAINHILLQHSDHIGRWVRIDYTHTYVYVHIYENRVFLIFFKHEQDFIYYSAMLIGTANDAELYIMKLKFFDQTLNGFNLSVCGPCNSICKFYDVFRVRKRILFATNLMTKFVNKNNFYECRVKILRPINFIPEV